MRNTVKQPVKQFCEQIRWATVREKTKCEIIMRKTKQCRDCGKEFSFFLNMDVHCVNEPQLCSGCKEKHRIECRIRQEEKRQEKILKKLTRK